MAKAEPLGSLNAPVYPGQVRQVGPNLGADAIWSGSIATVIGGFLVLVFMAVWYRGAGIVANLALILNVMLMLAGLSLFGWTLTLPGIAGIALTMGMAVDANIIIYERIRVDQNLGQHARKAVEIGFEKAELTRFDSNLDGSAPKFYRQAELYFASMDALKKGVATAGFKKVADDLKNFATGGLTGMTAIETK